ncbi:hypothetical protein PV328_000958 [Microctonus aethiopoides]|uniref:DUF4806 domain-containing protein n=1 Tax=Microctonus aethiopoides TaxID=144406 RepID=A0AA39FWG2_9HYME|nr:hypothetical protein PV328_000958 [Microctonus aethiopoides]
MRANLSTPTHDVPPGCHPPSTSFHSSTTNYPPTSSLTTEYVLPSPIVYARSADVAAQGFENTLSAYYSNTEMNVMSAANVSPDNQQNSNYTELHSVGQSHIRQFEAVVLRSLTKLEEKLNELANKIDQRFNKLEKLLNKLEIDNIMEPPQGFPLSNLEAFRDFEDADEEAHNALQQHLEILGGQSYREALNHYIRASMTNALAEEFSWTGQARGNSAAKISFMTTKMVRIFFRALKNSFKQLKPKKELFIKDLKEVLRSYKQTARNHRIIKQKKSMNKVQEMEVFSDEDN